MAKLSVAFRSFANVAKRRNAINLKRMICYNLFIYGLRNGAISSPECIASRDRIRRNTWKRMWKWSWSRTRCHAHIWMKMLGRTMKPREYTWFQRRNLNQGVPRIGGKSVIQIGGISYFFLIFKKRFWALFYRLLAHRFCKTHRNVRQSSPQHHARY
jgi:hypothetical protein